MLVGLHDSDKTDFPNYALMKISAWHKAQGDTVEWWNLCAKPYIERGNATHEPDWFCADGKKR